MEPEVYLWLFYSWLQQEEDNHNISKNYSILTGSFSNPEMAKKMLDKDNSIRAETSDEEFEVLSEFIDELPPINQTRLKKKKRKIKI